MNTLLQIDWSSILIPSMSLLEIFLRGTVVYLFLFFLMRILRRQAGAIGIPDLLLVVLIADAAQNAMSSEYKSITEGVVLVATIAFWDYFLDWLGYRFPKLRRLVRSSPLPLSSMGLCGRVRRNMEAITQWVPPLGASLAAASTR